MAVYFISMRSRMTQSDRGVGTRIVSPRCARQRAARAIVLVLYTELALAACWSDPGGVALLAAGPEASAAAGPDYAAQIAPLLAARCGTCHDAHEPQGELVLTTPQGLRRGGSSGKLLVPGAAQESLLIKRVAAGEMPPEGRALSPAEVELLRAWIDAGAPLGGTETGPPVTQHDVLPILQLRCTVCHGRRVQEGGLDLRTVEGLLQGGKSGPAAVPGDPDGSLVVQRVRAGEMPPPRRVVEVSVKPMTSSELALLERWIAAGMPRAAAPATDAHVTDADRQHWSFVPPREPPIPQVQAAARVRNPIDAFVLARLEAEGLSPAPEADRRTLLRRAYADLWGLPPKPEEVEAFLADTAADAYERLIDRLLASHHYGERWARYWLDLAGYSDSEGVQNSDPVRSNAWRYRDYVIRSFAADKPYDRFLLEQLAGDELADYERAAEITPELADNLIATGFLRMTADGTFACITGFVPDRLEVIHAELDVLASTVMGLTMRCAQCHAHKFDPISQRDYYRLAAVFKGAYDEHDWLKPTADGQGALSPFPVRELPYVATAERQAWEQTCRAIDEQLAALDRELHERAAILRKQIQETRLAEVPSRDRQTLREALALPDAERSEEQRTLYARYEAQLALPIEELAALNEEFKQFAESVAARKRDLQAARPPEPTIRALWDRGEPSPTYVLRRGNYLAPGEPVEPGVPEVLEDPAYPYTPQPPWPGAASTGRRLAFARWLVRPEHPLTARVIVNRVWRHHFGAGLVRTLDNFGRTGAAPTHPELLDWLAVQLPRHGWSLKWLHRLIMTSAVYRQSSAASEALLALDPENRLLGRMPLRRLDAEALRDTLLAVSGKLVRTAFGPPDGVAATPDGLVLEQGTQAGWRRSIYLLQRRTQPITLLEAFDQPRMSPNCVERSESNVAPQALHLLNDRRVRELADFMADELLAECGEEHLQPLSADCRPLLNAAWLRTLARLPAEEEYRLAHAVYERLAAEWEGRLAAAAGEQPAPSPRPEAHRRALGNICHALLNTAELLYVD